MPSFAESLSMPIPPNIFALVEHDMKVVDKIIRERLDSGVPLVRQVAEYIVDGGGKRLRPILLLLSAGAAGYRGSLHHEIAAVIEIIHTATLLHDDVVDNSELRRGQQTANVLFGNAASVLVGDYLHSCAFRMMVGIGNMHALRVMADAVNIIVEGEVKQLAHCHNADIDEEDYLQVIRCKTAKLFELAAHLGAIIGESDNADAACMAKYGAHLGMSFQLIDDVLDYSGDAINIGKQLGDDLAEGKPTLPLIHVIKQGTPGQASIVRHAIETGGRDQFNEVLKAMHATGALQYARSLAEREAAAAIQAISELRNSKYKKALLEFTVFAVERDH